MTDEMKIADPSEFQIKLDKVGMDTRSSGYALMTDESALALAVRSVETMAKEFVGENKKPDFKADLAVALLSTIDGIDFEEVPDRVEDWKQGMQEHGFWETARRLYVLEEPDQKPEGDM